MPASTFARFPPIIGAIAVDIEAEADFRVLAEELQLFAGRGDQTGAAARRVALRREVSGVLLTRPHVRVEVAAFDLVSSLATSGTFLSDEDVVLIAKAMGRACDCARTGSVTSWGQAFEDSVGDEPPGVDSVEWVALQLIVATRRKLVSGMTSRRVVVGLLAWCVAISRIPPPAMVTAIACVGGLVDPLTAEVIWPRLDMLAGGDAKLALAVAARDVEAGGRTTTRSLAQTFPDLTRQKLRRVRLSRGYRRARRNLGARNEAARLRLFSDD